MKNLIFLTILTAVAACSDDAAVPELAAPVADVARPPPNILLIIGDDMGVETLASYGVGENPAKTATLDRLAAEGVQFTNFWSQPVCSPTRATMLTGRYAFRTGVGRPGGEGDKGGPFPDEPQRPASASFETPRGMGGRVGDNWNLPPDEYTLPMAIKSGDALNYATAAIGKWHLADNRNGWAEHPNKVGFDHFSGRIFGWPASYYAWNKLTDGQFVGTTGYSPNEFANDALQWIGEQGDRPWFLWYAFNLPHLPLHMPPEELWQADHSDIDPKAEIGAGSKPHFHAMMEAMDSEIGKLLAALEPDARDNTYVIFMGDNGTDRNSVSAPFRPTGAKGSVYQGGVNVPLIVTGPGVAKGASSDALVNSTDMFATIIEMAGIHVDEVLPDGVTIDSVSFMPYLAEPDGESRRDWLYADYFDDNFDGVETASYAMRNQRYKFLRVRGVEEFYDLAEDPYEHNNLLAGDLTPGAQAEYEGLRQQLRELRGNHEQQ
jgi:arylsulfatase A-like enzyme